MTKLRQHVTRISRESLDAFKSAMGIESPSRAFADLRWDKLTIDGEPWPPATRTALTLPPWYAARGPLEPYETPELAAAARCVRRLIRRHWWALLFEPESSTAASVRAAMATPPEQTGGLSWLDVARQLGALGMTPIFGSGYARKIFDDAYARAEHEAYVALVGAT